MREPASETRTRHCRIVSIVGPSNAGKSEVAKRTAERLGNDIACRIPTDYFIIPRKTNEFLTMFLAQPLKWDWALLRQRLKAPVGSGVATPDFDFEDFTRQASNGGKPFTVRPVMLTDAMAACPYADLVVRIDAPNNVRHNRVGNETGDGEQPSRHVLITWN